jgi:D-alanyl-D-alanine dipeptidase
MRTKWKYVAILLLLPGCASLRTRPSDFVPLADVDPSIAQDMRYFGEHNFLGRPVIGYEAPRCLLAREAAEALKAVQDDLRSYGLSLKVYDCYRPQRAVDDFVAWARDVRDTKMKKEFYPAVDKSVLFNEGYIAMKSGHSRGATIDLTIDALNMGTSFDFFDPLSHTANPAVAPEARKNRLLLKAVMEKHGFRNLPEEWWHYTLVKEPHPNTFFNFEIR